MTPLDPAQRRLFASLVLLTMAFAALAPGVTLPVIELTGTVEKAEIATLGKEMIVADDSINRWVRGITVGLIDTLDARGTVVVYAQQRSIWGTVTQLWKSGNPLVSFLVMLFSIIIPVCKGILILIASLGQELRWRGQAMATANAISKWSMADVFVIAIIISLLAANASGDAGEMVTFDAQFGRGFYFFVTYCLLSIASAQLMPYGVVKQDT